MLKTMLISLVLLVLLFSTTFSYESFAKLNMGAYMQDGQTTQFGILAGSNSVLLTDKEKGTRMLAYTGVMHVNKSDEIQGFASFVTLEKFWEIKTVTIYADFGTGTLWQMKDNDDVLTADILVEGGIRIKNWVNLGLGFNYLPQKGPDAIFPYLSVNLVSPL